MEFLNQAFRAEPDGWKLKLMSPLHLLLVFIIFSLSFLVWKKRAFFRTNDLLRKPLAVTLFLQFSILYSWYFTTGYTGIRESLPLYNCRLAIICCVIALITGHRLAQLIACYWGLSGGILAVLLPSMDPFSWPHYTQISFMIGHLALLCSVLYIIAIDRPAFNRHSLNTMLIFSTLYHIAIAWVDYALCTNYCFLKEFPFGELPFLPSNTPGYTVFVILMHNLVVLFTHFALKLLTKKERAASEMNSLLTR